MATLLKEKIRNYRSILFRLPKLPTTLKTEEKALELGGFASEKPLSVVDLEKCYHSFLNALDSGDWQQLSAKDWKNAVYVMWYGERTLAKETIFRAYFHEYLQQQATGLRWKSFIRAYLVHFKRHEATPDIYREFAESIMQGLEHPSCYLWKQYHEDFRFFDKNFSVEKMAEVFIVQSNSEWSHFIQRTGMTGELATCEYMQAVAAKLLQWLHHVPDKAYQILPFFEDKQWKELRFAMLHPQLIDALLLPWREKKPTADHQHDIQQWLLTYFGDPRLHQTKHKWLGVSEDALAVMRKWLIGETIRQFFSIIDRFALDHHWSYRRAFWEAYYNKQHISDAYFVLGANAKCYAKQVFDKEITAGEIVGGQHQRNQSVLLLHIGEYIFAEWSHNGKCRAWYWQNEDCPRLWKRDENGRYAYDSSEFRTPSMTIVPTYKEDGIIHHSSETYGWQQKLAEFIDYYTGIKVDSHAYRI